MSVSLVTLEDVRNFLQKPDSDQQQDAILGRLIEVASGAVINYTTREFVDSGVGSSRQFYYCGDGVLNLAPYDIRSGSTIVVTVDTTDGVGGTVLSSAEYKLFPRPPKDGVYNWMRLNPLNAYPPAGSRFYEREVTVTGTWGFPSVPDDVKHWTTVTVAEWFRLNVASYSTTFNLQTEQLDRPEMLPSAVRAGLYRYRMC